MKPCLLCLEINNNSLDCIRVNTIQWQELDIEQIIAKHFWPLDTDQPGSWICLSCWREVEGFHKFYSRIEEAHTNFGEIKIEDGDELQETNIEFYILEPEPDQELEFDFEETETITEHSPRHELLIDKITEESISIDELDNDDNDVPVKVARKRLRVPSDLESDDPLQKSKKFKNCKAEVEKEKKSTEYMAKDSKVKYKPPVLSDNDDVKEITDNYNDDSDVNDKSHRDRIGATQRKKRGVNHPNREENDKFIAEHLKEMICDLCKIPLQDFSDMQKHYSETHKLRGYIVCCKKRFSNRTRLVDHLHCHLNPDHFKCGECGKIMSDRVKFNNHMLHVHRADEVVKQHRCDVCGKAFKEAYVLRSHKAIHLPEEEKQFPCSDCDKKYGSAFLLNHHIQVVHLKRFVKVCHICGKGIHSFKTHMRKHEGIKTPIVHCDVHCDVCGLRLTSERGLKMHKEYQHPVGGKQDHHCPFCDKISPTARALKKHINTMHEKGYDHKCTICVKAFKRPESLKEHMATHTGTPLYTCRWCPMTFNSNCNMNSHHKSKHPKEYLELKSQKYRFQPVS